MQEIDFKSLPSILDIVNNSLHLRTARIIKRRMEGASLHDIALEEDLTRTEARSTEKKGLEKIFSDDLLVREDEYRYIYETYSFDDEFYRSLINGNQLLYYLKNRYDIGFGSIERALQDSQITDKIKNELEAFFKIDTSDNDDTNLAPETTTTRTISSSIVEEPTNYEANEDIYNINLVPQYIREAINDLWNTFQACGITEPSKILEQASIFFFLKYLDDAELENTSECFVNGTTIKNKYFDAEHQGCRWSYFHNLDAIELFRTFTSEIMPFIKNDLRVDTNITYSQLVQDIPLSIADPTLLTKIVSTIDSITASSHTNLYTIFEILVSLAGADFRVIDLLGPMIDLKIDDCVCNAYPANDFSLSSIAAYTKEKYKDDLEKVWHTMHFKNDMFHTYNANFHILVISTLRLLLQDITAPDIQDLDIITEDCPRQFTKVIAKIPTKVSVNQNYVHSDIKSMITANIPSLMYMYGCHRLLESNGICAMSVSHKNLTESSASHRRLREFYLKENTILGVISLPSHNRDLLVYQNVSPQSFHHTLFAQIDELTVDIIDSVSSLMYEPDTENPVYTNQTNPIFYVSDIEIEEHCFNLGYEEYSTKSHDIIEDIRETEELDAILRRIYNTQSDIDREIITIKELLEKL